MNVNRFAFYMSYCNLFGTMFTNTSQWVNSRRVKCGGRCLSFINPCMIRPLTLMAMNPLPVSSHLSPFDERKLLFLCVEFYFRNCLIEILSNHEVWNITQCFVSFLREGTFHWTLHGPKFAWLFSRLENSW